MLFEASQPEAPQPTSGRTYRTRSARFSVLASIVVVCGAEVIGLGAPVSTDWQEKVLAIAWVTYSPPTANPDRGISATPESIRKDFATLRSAGFTGVVTYGGGETFANAVLAAARAERFKGWIVGVWDPTSQFELDAAKAVSSSPIVLGYCVGNEGYGRRYKRETLLAAIEELRQATGKPVTTSEELDDYIDDEVVGIGDWVFPNAHPYFHGRFDPVPAVRWTSGAYDELRSRSKRFVWFKEVGLPTTGNAAHPLSQAAQEEYYVRLAKARVIFAHFEAFDQPWKRPGTVEPHWGLFRSDGTPKQFGKRLLAKGALPRPAELLAPLSSERAKINKAAPTREPLYVYDDGGSPKNHFSPTGLDGDCGDVRVDDRFESDRHSGKTCLRIVYDTKGNGPNLCVYAPPCKWAALGWRHPAGNNGKKAQFKGKGLDLSGFSRLVFWAKADAPCKIRFVVGGLDETFGDSLTYPRGMMAVLDGTWRQFEINLEGADLRHIINAFGWATSWDLSPKGMTLYLDDIRFE